MELAVRLRRPRGRRWWIVCVLLLAYATVPSCWTRGGSDMVSLDDLHFDISVAVAWMLIGAVAFMMALFYLVNNSDPEIRMYSWQVISSTINIFCAVLIFSASNRLVEHYAFEHISKEMRHLHSFAIIVDFLHMLVWMLMMVLVLWFAAVRKQNAGVGNGDGDESTHRHELDVKSWAMLFAHVAGFAAINCFGDLQQLFFSGSPNQSELVVPISATCLIVLAWLAERAGQYLYKADLKEHDAWYFELWEEQTHDAENDIAALCLSFLTCQSLRYHTGGHLPDPEGNEPPATRAEVLLFCSLIFAVAASLSVQLSHLELKTLRRRPQLKRVLAIFKLICCMCCAWCGYFGGKRLFFASSVGNHVVEMIARIVLAVIFSVVAFGMVLMMNMVVDQQKMSEAKSAAALRPKMYRKKSESRSSSRSLSFADNVQLTCQKLEHSLVLQGSKTLIKAMAILVGFSWEQAFDCCVGKTCERLKILPPHIAEVVLAALLAGMILPAWRIHILPNCEFKEE